MPESPISSPFPEPIQNLFSGQKSPLLQTFTPTQLEALKFALSGAFLGTTAGLSFGGVTALMRGLESTPAGRANILKSLKVFGLAGVTYGLSGAGLVLVREADDYWTRVGAACSAGLSIGLHSRSLPVSCAGCVALGTLAAFAKFVDEQSPTKESPTLKMFTDPLYRRDEKWTFPSK